MLFTWTPLVIQTCYTGGGGTLATGYQASRPLVQVWPLLWLSRSEIAPDVIQLFFWLDLSQPPWLIPWACSLLGAARILLCGHPSASSSLVSGEVRVVLVNDLGERCLLSGRPALASSASTAFLFKPFPHLDVLFGLASNKDFEMDLVTDNCKIWHIRGGSTFILYSLHTVDFKRRSGLNYLPSLAQ